MTGQSQAASSAARTAPRARPKVVTLTPAAVQRIRDIMDRADKTVAGLKVGVKNGGCAGMSYTMEWASEAGKFDEVIEQDGARVLIDSKAVLFLLGTQMDYRTDKFSSNFVFNNPNETSACGCGESVAITPAKAETLG